MEGIDGKLLVEIRERHPEFRRLYQEHLEIHNRLARMVHRNYLTPEETLEEKRLKICKLHGRERMMEIIRSFSGETLQASA